MYMASTLIFEVQQEVHTSILGAIFFNKYGIFIIYYKLILLYFFNGARQLNHTHDRCQS